MQEMNQTLSKKKSIALIQNYIHLFKKTKVYNVCYLFEHVFAEHKISLAHPHPTCMFNQMCRLGIGHQVAWNNILQYTDIQHLD